MKTLSRQVSVALLWALMIASAVSACRETVTSIKAPAGRTAAPVGATAKAPQVKPTTQPALSTIFLTPLATPTPNPVAPKLVGQVGGASYAVAAQGHYAYLGVGPRLAIVDVSDPRTPRIIGRSEVLPGMVQKIIVRGERAYVGAGKSLAVIDVSVPTEPRLIGQISTFPWSVQDFALQGNGAYVGLGEDPYRAQEGAFWIVDLTNLNQPRAIASLEFTRTVVGVGVAGAYAYVSTPYAEPRIIDISEPTRPVEIANAQQWPWIASMVVNEQTAYIVGPGSPFTIWDVADGAHPRTIGSLMVSKTACYDLAVSGNYVYVAKTYCDMGSCMGGMVVIDISAPSEPRIASSLDTGTASTGIAVMDSWVYLATEVGLQIYDVSDPTNPQLVGKTNALGAATMLTVSDGYAWVGSDNGTHLINVQSPDKPVEVGVPFVSPNCGTCLAPLQDVAVTGNRGYVVNGNTLDIVDAADSSAWQEIGHLVWPEAKAFSFSVAAHQDYLYLADRDYLANIENAKLRVVNVNNPALPYEMGSIQLTGDALDMVVSNNDVYVLTSKGLSIVDVTEPTNPRSIGGLFTHEASKGDSGAGSMVIVDDYAYLATAYPPGLWIVNVSDPVHLREVTYLELPEGAYDVAVTEGYAYVVAGYYADAGLYVINVSNPAAPRTLGRVDNLSSRSKLTAIGDFLFVAGPEAGLRIFRLGH